MNGMTTIPENVEDLRRFFDKYLKGIENGWEQTPTIRLSVLTREEPTSCIAPKTSGLLHGRSMKSYTSTLLQYIESYAYRPRIIC